MSILSLENVTLSYRGGFNIFSRSKKIAIDNLSLEIAPGENLGVLGRNGAGKSTLLKLLAGIYKPDSGKVRYSRGLRSAFIGLQNGFVPYLSGRDNAMLTGMLIGMSKPEIRHKLPQIIEYSELGEVIDRPVFTYSAGMRARLAFGVSVFSEPDLLLIDEAMSVGDKSFREKSHKTISELISSDAAVVLVSHEPALINKLCNKAIWFENGIVRKQGDCDLVTDSYTRSFGIEEEIGKIQVKTSGVVHG